MNRFVLRTICFLICALVFGAQQTHAYHDTTTHPALTELIVDYYNQTHPGQKITAEQKEWIIKGSALEDTPPRWVNHFYDPISGEGWTGEYAGNMSPEAVMNIPDIAIAPAGPFSAIEWIRNEKGQARYGLYQGNHTWDHALTRYAKWYTEDAFISLGYVLHVLEDMAVPDHTRNDTHIELIGDPSPYEDYARYWTRDTIGSLHIPESIEANNGAVVRLPTIEDYFDSLAAYSNKYFVSKDTINNDKYALPAIDADCEGSLCYATDFDGKRFPLCLKETVHRNNISTTSYFFNNNEVTKGIFRRYFTNLAYQATLHGAGVIDLFFREATIKEESGVGYPSRIVGVDWEPFNIRNKFFSFLAEGIRLFSPVLDLRSKISTTAIEAWNEMMGGENEEELRAVYGASVGNTIVDMFKRVQENEAKYIESSPQTPEKGETNDNGSGEENVPEPEPTQTSSAPQPQGAQIAALASASEEEFVATTETTEKEPEPTYCAFDVPARTFSWEVVINEVAWMGTKKSSSDEWIEIANVTDVPVDVSGWQLVDKDEKIRIIFDEGEIIKPGGFLLLERTDDNSVLGIPADHIYTGSLSNSNEGLRLFDADCRMKDQTTGMPSWPAGISSERRTMERTGRGFIGIERWHTSSIIEGTPKSVNSAPYKKETSSTRTYRSSGGGAPASVASITTPLPSMEITEIMYDVAGSDEGNEWIELVNTGTDAFSLDAISFFENDTDHRIVCENGCLLSHGGYAVVTSNKEQFRSTYPEYAAMLIESTFSLSNTGEALAFTRDGLVIDSYTYSSETGAAGDGNSLQEGSDGIWIAALPTPGYGYTVPTSTASIIEEDVESGTTADNVVISEVAYDAEGSDEGKEYVELYNPTNGDVSLDGWRLVYEKDGERSTVALFGGSAEDITTIPAHGFLLIGCNGYDASYFGDVLADISRSASLPNSGDVALMLLAADEAVVSEVKYVAYGAEAGTSIERYARSDDRRMSPLPDEEGEFLGNGYMADAEEFVVRYPQPQNTHSLPEPRADADDLWGIAYNKDELTMTATFSGGEGSLYELSLISDSGEELWYEGSDNTFSKRIFEVGKTYLFKLVITDTGDHVSESEKEVTVPSFISDIAWYRVPKGSWYETNGVSESVFSLSYDAYPFVPTGVEYDRYPYGGPYDEPNVKLIVFYKNTEPEAIAELGDHPYPELSSEDVLRLGYTPCRDSGGTYKNTLVLRDINVVGEFDGACFYDPELYTNPYFSEGDMTMTFPTQDSEGDDLFTDDDFITIAYYEMQYPKNDPKPVSFALLAVDNTRYGYDGEGERGNGPQAPQSVGASFNDLTSELTVSVSGAKDPDDLDTYIRYEISFDGGVTWEDERFSATYVRVAEPETTYRIAVRAIDSMGNTSSERTTEYTTSALGGDRTVSDIAWHAEGDDTFLSFSITPRSLPDGSFWVVEAAMNGVGDHASGWNTDTFNNKTTDRLILTPSLQCAGSSTKPFVSFGVSSVFTSNEKTCGVARYVSDGELNLSLPAISVGETYDTVIPVSGTTGADIEDGAYITLSVYYIDGWGGYHIIERDTKRYYLEGRE